MSATELPVFTGGAAGLAGDRHQAGEALRDQVEAALVAERPVAAVARHRAVDQPGILGGEHVVAEPELLQRALAIVLGQHVGVAHHAQQDRRGPPRASGSSAMPRLLRFRIRNGADTPLTRGSR